MGNFCLKVVSISLALILSVALIPRRAITQEQSPQSLNNIDDLLHRMEASAMTSSKVFRDLIAKENRTFEVFSSNGDLENKNHLVSDYLVYVSQLNSDRRSQLFLEKSYPKQTLIARLRV